MSLLHLPSPEETTVTVMNDGTDEREEDEEEEAVFVAHPESTPAEREAAGIVDRWTHVDVHDKDVVDFEDTGVYRSFEVPRSVRDPEIPLGCFFKLINDGGHRYPFCHSHLVHWMDAEPFTDNTVLNVQRGVEGKVYKGRYYRFAYYDYEENRYTPHITFFIGVNEADYAVCVATAFIDLRDPEVRKQWEANHHDATFTTICGYLENTFATITWDDQNRRTTKFNMAAAAYIANEEAYDA